LAKETYNKTARIRKRAEFVRLSNQGKKVFSKYFIALYSPGIGNQNRLGITVTKRVGNAVTRNRIKRYVREFFRQHQHTIEGAWDINIIAKMEAANITSAQAFASLRSLFERLRKQIC
jgi:ribonuclease P protein component